MSDTKKTIILWGVSFLVGFYCVLVMQHLWNWFAAPILRFGEMSYLEMYGLNMLFGLVSAKTLGENPAETLRWRMLGLTVEACVPESNKETVKEQVEEEASTIWLNMGTWVFGTVASYTVTLIIGFAIHVIA